MPRPRNQVLEFDLELTGRSHELKTWPVFYDAIAEGWKPFELRRNDRTGGFRVGDLLILREWDPQRYGLGGPGGYTNRQLERVVTYVLRGEETGRHTPQSKFLDGSSAPFFFPVALGWAILGLALPPST